MLLLVVMASRAVLTIPNLVQIIGINAFSGCIGFTSIVSDAVTPPVATVNTFNGVDKGISLYLPHGASVGYQAATDWKDFTNIIETEGAVTVTVTFDSNGSSAVAPVEIEQGNTIIAPMPPVKDGHVFTGWFKETALTTEWNFAADVVYGNSLFMPNGLKKPQASMITN